MVWVAEQEAEENNALLVSSRMALAARQALASYEKREEDNEKMAEAEREERKHEGDEAGEQQHQPLPPPPTPAVDIRMEQEAEEQHALLVESRFILAQYALVSYGKRK